MGYYDSYSYETTVSGGDAAGITILLIYLIVLLVWGLVELTGYILKGIGMYTIAKRRGMDYPWLAYVPFARAYLQGELGGEIVLKDKKIQNPGIWLLALPFIHGALFFVFYIILWAVGIGAAISAMNSYSGPGVGSIIALLVVGVLFIGVMVVYSGIYKVLQILVDHQILERFTSKNMSIAHGVLSALIPLYEPICFFVMRNKPFRPGMEPERMTFNYGGSAGDGFGQDMQNGNVQETQQESGFVPQRGLLNNMPENVDTQETASDQTAGENPSVIELPDLSETSDTENLSENPEENKTE